MKKENLTITLTVEQSPEQVYDAINDVPRWWSGQVEGEADRVGAEFTYRYRDMHVSRQRVTELVPGQRVVWHVVDSRLTFLKDQAEWTGTDIVFDITPRGEGTELRFTHRGLTPEVECWDACSNGWGMLINDNLKTLIMTGQGQPDVFA